MSRRPDEFGTLLASLSAGTTAAKEGVTYGAGLLAVIPPIITAAIASLSLSDRFLRFSNALFSGDPVSALDSLVFGTFWWTVAILFVTLLSFTWAAVVVGLRVVLANQGRRPSATDLFGAALGRIPSILLAWILLALLWVGLIALTWILRQVADVAGLSLVVALAAIPLIAAWALGGVATFLSLTMVPAFAAAQTKADGPTLLRRVFGAVLSYPAATISILGLGALIAGVMAMVLYGAAVTSGTIGANLLLEPMLFGGRTISAAIVAAALLLLIAASFWAPWGVFVGSVATFAGSIGVDPDLDRRTDRFVSGSVQGVRRAAAAAGTAVDSLKNRIDEATATTSEEAPPPGIAQAPAPAPHQSHRPPLAPTSDPDPPPPPTSSPPPDSSPTSKASTTSPATRSCDSCGGSNPASHAFCSSCGRPLPESS